MGKGVAVAVVLGCDALWSAIAYLRHGTWSLAVTMGALILYLPLAIWLGHRYDCLIRLSKQDELTGLANRRFVRWYGERLLRHRRFHPVACLLLDVDDFKQGVNDRFGHGVGDEVLVQVARAVAQVTPGNAVVGRWGGEEFIVLLPKTVRTQALGLAETVRRTVAASTRPAVTLSIGVALAPEDGTSLRDLVDRADRALYAAKREKNRCQVWRPEMSVGG